MLAGKRSLHYAQQRNTHRGRPRTHTQLLPSLSPLCTGFAVVKRGRDKLSGEPVAIKVGGCRGSWWGGVGRSCVRHKCRTRQ